MSSSSFSARRQIWSNQHPLRKQRSLIESGLSSGGVLGRSERGKYSLLQKQFSVEHVYTKSARQGRFNVRYADNKQSEVNRCSGGSSSSQRTLKSNEPSELGLSVLNKKKHPVKSYGEFRKDKAVGDRLRKAKGNEDRINLNIFLAHTATVTDYDGASSDLESPSESLDIAAPEKKTPEKVAQSVVRPNLSEPKRPPSAATRRAQFKASRAAQNTPVGSSALLSAFPPSLTVERRPPLVRAMSAPVRALDENSKNILANKRKPRRRKILTRNPSCDKSTIVETSFDDNDENCGEKGRGKNNKKGRARSALGCDVVTLVSLISSEGSDSEKEDLLPPAAEVPVRRAPLLRKTGKSVSFQENEPSNFISQNKEFPQVLRRGSIAPLAARIRANRPPTAPPVSIFAPNRENRETTMSEEHKEPTKEEEENTAPSNPEQSDSKGNESDAKPEVPEKQFPKYVRSLKERECWKLFVKMSNKGVSVSYDTILRGMLTPTELRVLQKQKELEEAKKLAEEQAASDDNPQAGDKSKET